MATQEDEYYMDLLENMIEHNFRTKTPLSKEKLQQEINTIVAETEEEEHNANNETTDNFIHPLPHPTPHDQYTKRENRR